MEDFTEAARAVAALVLPRGASPEEAESEQGRANAAAVVENPGTFVHADADERQGMREFVEDLLRW